MEMLKTNDWIFLCELKLSEAEDVVFVPGAAKGRVE